MLQHGQLVPSLNVAEPNPAIASASSPFYVNTACKEWPGGYTPRRAGVSSFGIGGTNAHVVVEEPPAREPAAAPNDCQLLVLSARSAAALDKLTDDLARQLHKERATVDLASVAYTLAIRRRQHSYRRALVCRDAQDAAVTLALREPDRVSDNEAQVDGPAVTFVFADRLRDGGERAATLYRDLPAFRNAVDRCLTTPGAPTPFDPASLLRAGGASAAVVAQCALAELWTAWGVQPKALVGFGTGEFAASCFAGVFPVPVALGLATVGSGGQPSEFAPAVPRWPLWSVATGGWMPTHVATDRATWQGPRAEIADSDTTPTTFGHPNQVTVEMRPDALDPAASNRKALLITVGWLWTRGVAVDWAALFDRRRHRRIPLPTYPFERKRYWIEPSARAGVGASVPRSIRDTLRRQVEEAEGTRKAEVVQTFIRGEVAAKLGLDSAQLVDPDQDLFSLGIGSLELIDIAARLSAELQAEIPVSLLVDVPTIRVYAENVVSPPTFGGAGLHTRSTRVRPQRRFMVSTEIDRRRG